MTPYIKANARRYAVWQAVLLSALAAFRWREYITATLAMDALLLLGVAGIVGYMVAEYMETRDWVECEECGRRYPGDGLRCQECDADLLGERYITADLLAEHAAEMERGL